MSTNHPKSENLLITKPFLQKGCVNRIIKTSKKRVVSNRDPLERTQRSWLYLLGILDETGGVTPTYTFAKRLPEKQRWQLFWVNLFFYCPVFSKIITELAWSVPYDRSLLIDSMRKWFDLPPIGVQGFFHLFQKTPFSQFGQVKKVTHRTLSMTYHQYKVSSNRFPVLQSLAENLQTPSRRRMKDLLVSGERLNSHRLFSSEFDLLEGRIKTKLIQNFSRHITSTTQEYFMLHRKGTMSVALSWYFINIGYAVLRRKVFPLKQVYALQEYLTPYELLGMTYFECQDVLQQLPAQYGVSLYKGEQIVLSLVDK